MRGSKYSLSIGAAALLHRMRQLMRQQMTTGRAVRLIPSFVEIDVAAVGKSLGIDFARGSGRTTVVMHAHGTEVLSEARLEKFSRRARERLAGATARAES